MVVRRASSVRHSHRRRPLARRRPRRPFRRRRPSYVPVVRPVVAVVRPLSVDPPRRPFRRRRRLTSTRPTRRLPRQRRVAYVGLVNIQVNE